MLTTFFTKIVFLFKASFIDFLIWKENITIKTAQTKKELEEVYRFIWKVYSEEDYIEADDYPNRKLEDKYSKVSVYFLAFKNQKIVGTVRLILPSKLGFPTENAFNFSASQFPREKTAEVSKFCIYKNYREVGVSLGLLKKVYKYSKKINIKYWLVGIPPYLKNYFEESLNLNFILIPTNPLRLEHIRERKSAKKYFQKTSIEPYLLDINKIGN